jgi:pimeloyl-ACP methyl ester carboxylesterase
MDKFSLFLLCALTCSGLYAQSPADTLILTDIRWDATSPAGMEELNIPSAGSLLQGFIYEANGPQKHPTLLMLHGYPGNEKNLDLAQVARAHGWNVVYFDYRGSWSSQGEFSFKHCVEDVVNTVSYCKKHAGSLKIDTTNIVLFGHSMGGWICLKALQQLPEVRKGFALSTWDIHGTVTQATKEHKMAVVEKGADDYFVLNKKSGKDLFAAVTNDLTYFDLHNDGTRLRDKQIIMLDEHHNNESIARAIHDTNKSYFSYEVWPTDHPFTNKRVALIKKVLAFLDK